MAPYKNFIRTSQNLRFLLNNLGNRSYTLEYFVLGVVGIKLIETGEIFLPTISIEPRVNGLVVKTAHFPDRCGRHNDLTVRGDHF